jgi:hypothetical protein
MSIFKDTLSPYVQNQLRAREIIISQGTPTTPAGTTIITNVASAYGNVPRSDTFMRYVSGKNSWVKMTSFVDFNGTIGTKSYSGDALARKYVLEGGTLFEDPTNPGKFNLRSGVGKQSSAYGGNLGNRQYGYRPMPGISSVNIVNKSAYGSLREATIKFYAWDKNQLEELELLFMRTGYSILLEWGWSQYLDSNDLNNISIKNFDTPTINAFSITQPAKVNPNDPDLSADEIIYRKIEALNSKTYGNYDGMLGYVKNFSWQLLPNGGYECSTILISRGEVISTLKLSSNSNNIDLIQSSNNVPTLSQFEQTFLNYAALVNKSELGSGGEFGGGAPTPTPTPTPLPTTTPTPTPTPTTTPVPITTSNNPLNFQITSTSVDLLLDSLKKLADPKTGTILYTDNNQVYNGVFLTGLDPVSNLNYFGGTILTEGTNFERGGYGIEYIRFDAFITVLNLLFNFKDEKNNVVADIRIPSDNLCLASIDTVSVDPTTCIIKNTRAKGILLETSAGDGFDPNIIKDYDPTTGNAVKIDIPEFLKPGSNNRGYIRNIYVAIPKIIEVYRSKMSGTSDVSATEFLKALLSEISRSLGGINNFQLHTTKSSAQIIDVKYLEEGNTSSQKYTFDLIGLKSICRDVKIQSRIFESQSTMIAIAAQDRSNVGDLYSSTQVYLNAGLTDRLIKSKKLSNKDSTFQEFVKQLYGVISNLGYYLRVKVLADNSFLGIPKTAGAKIIVPKPEEVSNAISALKSFLYQLRGDDLKYKAIIPFELEITLDGISGIVQGQVFKINKNILPQNYSDKNVGFIITGLSHSLQNNDWTTTIKTQICILDPDGQAYPASNYDKLIKALKAASASNQQGTFLVFCIADYLSEIFEKAFNNDDGVIDFRNVIKNARTGKLTDFNTYAKYWHNKQATALGSSASSINFPSTVGKLLNPTGAPSDQFDPKSVDILVFNSLASAFPDGWFKDSKDRLGKRSFKLLSYLGRDNYTSNAVTIDDYDPTSGNLVGTYTSITEKDVLLKAEAKNIKDKSLQTLLIPNIRQSIANTYDLALEWKNSGTPSGTDPAILTYLIQELDSSNLIVSYFYIFGNRQAIYDKIFTDMKTTMQSSLLVPMFSKPNDTAIATAKANPNFKSLFVEEGSKDNTTYKNTGGVITKLPVSGQSYFLIKRKQKTY